MMQFSSDLILTDKQIQLAVLSELDQVDLESIAQDPRIWEYNPNFNDPKEFIEKWFLKALSQKSQSIRIPLVIRYYNKIIGSSSYYDFDPVMNTISVGYTWIVPEYWGSGVNAMVKKLMLRYACENGIVAVHFVIDILNKRSQQSVIKLGAKEQGIYRNHMKRPDGTMRDSIIYCIDCMAQS